jgi:carbamoyl-phosphate synthase large subunit
MKNILVSGASGIVGYGILRSLKKSDKKLKLFGSTIYTDSIAEYFCDVLEIAPLTSDNGYLQWLIDTIKKNEINLIIPGIEADLYKWAEHIEEIEKTGAKVLLNNLELINLCKDKWKFYEYLSLYQTSSVIDSSLSSSFELLKKEFGLPFLLKPRRGFGSKGIVVITKEEDFKMHQQYCGTTLMAQCIVGNVNEEYTTSTFCDGKGSYFASMTLKRKLSKDGFTDKAEVVQNEDIMNAIKDLCVIFKPLGPTNFQFRLHNGEPKLLEINPRISSSTSIRTSFGYNESLMAVEFFLENSEPEQPVIKQGKAIRFVEDLIIYK